MALIRWEPARELRSPRSDFDRLFGSVFDTTTFVNGGRPAPRRFAPALDIVEAESDYVITADLPGLSERDVAIEVEDNVLTISGQRRNEHEQKRDGYVRIERSFGSFRRSVALPEGTDAEAVTASFDRGVLEIHVPKPAQRQPRKVEITLGGTAPVVEADAASEAAAPSAS